MNDQVKNPYDKIIKEVFMESSLLQRIGDIEIKDTLPKLIFEPQTRVVDSLYLVYDKRSQHDKILHVEFQSSNDQAMEERMHDYLTFIRRKYKLPILQSLFYLGAPPMTMKDSINEDFLKYRYLIYDISDIDFKELLISGNPGDVLLALLGNLGELNQIEAIHLVLKQLKHLSKDKNELKRHFEFVILLGKLRKIDYLIKDEVQKIMIDVDYKDSVIYQDGKLEGKLEGEREKAIAIAKKMKAEGLALGLISRVTGLHKNEIEKL